MRISLSSALGRVVFCLTLGLALPMGSALARNGTAGLSDACRGLEGVYENSGIQLSGKDRGSRLPPLMSRDVLRQHKPGILTNTVGIQFLHDDRIRFSLQDQNGVAIIEYEHSIKCAHGQIVFERIATGGSEGFRGTSVTQVKLQNYDGGEALMVSVIFQSEGRDFMVLPHSDSSEREFLFKKRNDKQR